MAKIGKVPGLNKMPIAGDKTKLCAGDYTFIVTKHEEKEDPKGKDRYIITTWLKVVDGPIQDNGAGAAGKMAFCDLYFTEGSAEISGRTLNSLLHSVGVKVNEDGTWNMDKVVGTTVGGRVYIDKNGYVKIDRFFEATEGVDEDDAPRAKAKKGSAKAKSTGAKKTRKKSTDDWGD